MTAREKILIERYRLGELPQNLVEEVERIPNLKMAMEEFDQSDKEILEQYHFSSLERKIRRSKIGRWTKFLSVAAAIMLFAGTGLIFLRGDQGNGIRIKGGTVNGPELTIYRHHSDNVEILNDGADAQAGDLLQIGYKGVTPDTYGLIMSIDGAGNQTVHYPLSGDQALLLESGGEFYLPWSYELDDAPDYEAFFLLVSQRPFNLKDISAAALLEERIPSNIEVHGFMISKRD